MKNKIIVSVFNDTYNVYPPYTRMKEKIRSKNNYFLQKGDIEFKSNCKDNVWEVKTIISLPLYKFIWYLILYYPLLFLELSQSQGFNSAIKYLKNNFNKIMELNKEIKF